MAMYADGEFYLSFNMMLLFLYAMQVYWFGFIVKLLIKMAMGQTEVEDTREYEEDGWPRNRLGMDDQITQRTLGGDSPIYTWKENLEILSTTTDSLVQLQ